MPDFAALEQKVNASVFAHMANAAATFTPAVGDPVADVAVVFDAASAIEDPTTGTIVLKPALLMDALLASSLTVGDDASIVGTWGTGDYKVRQVLPLAEGGMRRVVLARA